MRSEPIPINNQVIKWQTFSIGLSTGGKSDKIIQRFTKVIKSFKKIELSSLGHQKFDWVIRLNDKSNKHC